jgi:hypothetical protein
MREVQASLADGWEPRRVHHLGLGLHWEVLEILESWTHPGWPRETYKKPVIERRHRLRVHGPLPGCPGQDGDFTMIATAYGDKDHWWIKPDDRPEPMMGVRSSWPRRMAD